VRNVLAIVIFVFGTTFWWMNSSVTGQTATSRPWPWVLTNVLVVLAFVGYIMTTWSVLRYQNWWGRAAIVAGVLGLLAVGAFILSQRTTPTGFHDFRAQLDVWFHLAGTLSVILLAKQPKLRNWVADAA